MAFSACQSGMLALQLKGMLKGDIGTTGVALYTVIARFKFVIRPGMAPRAGRVDLFALGFKVNTVAIPALLTLMFAQPEPDQRVIDATLVDAGVDACRLVHYVTPVAGADHRGMPALTRLLFQPDPFMATDAFDVRRPQ